MFKDQKVLVTGGNGMIGRQLVKLLLERGAKVYVADLNKADLPEEVVHLKIDLRQFNDCVSACEGMDYVFNLVGIKCSPKVTMEQPFDIMGPMMQFNTNMIEAALTTPNVKWFLYTSTVGVYTPAEIFYEDDVWNGYPSRNDWYGGWAKRMGELQCEAYEKQHGEGKCSIVRPANVYGPFDNFDPKNSMVVPSLIRKAYENDIIEVWGDGSSIRDFIHAKDVALGMLFAVENKITKPLNLGSGTGVTIKQLADTVANYFNKPIQWLTDKPAGDAKRIFSMERANEYGFYPSVSLEDGVRDAIEWFIANKDIVDKRYNILNK
jgi:GDP-L-fucose synthase